MQNSGEPWLTRFKQVQAEIHAACAASSRDPRSVRLLAVSKTHPCEAIQALLAFGQTDFGENYAQELASKAQALAHTAARFSFIGRLQSNKLKLIVQHAAEIQSLASAEHARHIERHAKALGRTPYPVYLSVNAGDEVSKDGVKMKDVPAFAAFIQRELPDLHLQGIMAIPPHLEASTQVDALQVPILYRELATMAHMIGEKKLSLGMSQDLRQAVMAGSHCVRIGTALFGDRS